MYLINKLYMADHFITESAVFVLVAL